MTTLTTPGDREAKRRVRMPIWLVLVLVLGGMTSVMALVIGVRFYLAGLSSADQLVKDLGRSGLAQLTATIESQLQPAADQARFLADILSRDQVDPDDNQRLQDLLLGSLAAVRQLRAVAYVGLDRRMVWAGLNDNGRGYSAQVTQELDEHQVPEILEEAKRRGTPFWAKPVLFNWPDGPLLIAVAPVFRDTEMVGIVGAARASGLAVRRVADEAGVRR